MHTTPRIDITVRHLRAFVTAYRTRNLTHAAEVLHVTQSAMSALIRQFELSLGLPMFERTPRALRPTNAGDAAYQRAEEILGLMTALQTDMREQAKDSEATLCFSCVPSLAAAVVPSVLAAFQERMPNVRVSMFDEGDDALVQRVLSQECEFSVSSFTHDPEIITQTRLLTDKVMVVCTRNSAIAAKERVCWSDLRNEPMIQLTRHASMHHIVSTVVPPSARPNNIVREVGWIHTALGMAAQGLGLVTLPGFLVKGSLQANKLIAKPLHDPVVEQGLLINSRIGHELSPAARLFLDMFRDHLESLPLD